MRAACVLKKGIIMETKKYKVALIGCGSIAPNHLGALAAIDNVEVVALCDVLPERAEKRRGEFAPDAKIYTDYEEMLNCEELDAVHIATPHYLHAPMAIEALKKDINVFLEKPVCINLQQLDELLSAEKSSKGKVCVCFQNRFNPSTVIAKRLAEADGGVRSAYGSVFWYRSEPYYTKSGWRGSYATEGGGVMINQAIHTIDLLCEFIGKPVSVTATKANHHLKGIIEVEDTREGVINFEDGRHANFYATTSFEGKDATTVFLVTKNHTIHIQYSAVYYDGVKIDDPSLVADFCGKECYGNGHKYLIAKFYETLAQGGEMPVALSDATYAIKVLLAAYRSNDEEVEI